MGARRLVNTPQNEAGDGIPDGLETFGGKLPAFAKYRIGADSFSEEIIQNLIYDCIREGKIDKETGNYYYKVTSKRAINTVVGSNGYIVTAHPMKIEDVPIPL